MILLQMSNTVQSQIQKFGVEYIHVLIEEWHLLFLILISKWISTEVLAQHPKPARDFKPLLPVSFLLYKPSKKIKQLLQTSFY